MALSFDGCWVKTLSMQTRDGTRLDADVYSPSLNNLKPEGPEQEGTWPVLLMRQPYGRAIASTVVYAHPSWYAAQGYIVVIQDVRGRGTSEGAFELFANEVTDGVDTVQWAAQLPHSNGQVGMYGFSYQGMTQLQAAEGCQRAGVSALKAIAPAMTGYHLYEDWAYENGALCLQLGQVWAIQLAAETARREGDIAAYQKLLAASRHLPLRDEIPAKPDVLSDVSTFFHQWVAQAQAGDYWQQLTPDLSGVDMPMLHIGGWFDPYLRGDFRLYQEMAQRSQYAQPLCVGPWAHIPWSHKVGEVDFGPEAASPIDRLQVQWFNHTLKHQAWTQPEVQLFEMGRNRWREFEQWPHSSPKTYFAYSDGLANIREDSGVLVENAAAANHEATDTGKRTDVLVHDPWNPAPALGGHSAIPAGCFERTAVDSRGDVLTYTSAPLTEEIRVLGVVKVRGAIAASAPSYDWCAVLSRVSNGKAYNLTQGYCRVEVTSEETELPLHPTCFSLAKGERLRLSLSAACAPAYAVNAGTGAPLVETRGIDGQIITLAISLGGDKGISVELPIVR